MVYYGIRSTVLYLKILFYSAAFTLVSCEKFQQAYLNGNSGYKTREATFGFYIANVT